MWALHFRMTHRVKKGIAYRTPNHAHSLELLYKYFGIENLDQYSSGLFIVGGGAVGAPAILAWAVM